MTEQERLERRIRIAEAMGFAWFQAIEEEWYTLFLPRDDDDNLHFLKRTKRPEDLSQEKIVIQWIPDYDADAEAREDLLEWFLSHWYSLEIHPTHEGTSVKVIYDKEIVKKEEDTYAEALLSAIDAAIQARGKEQP